MITKKMTTPTPENDFILSVNDFEAPRIEDSPLSDDTPNDKGLADNLNQKLHSIERDGKGWSDEMDNVIAKWMDTTNYLEFVYDSVLASLTKTFQRYNNCALIFSGLSTIVGFASSSGIADTQSIAITASSLSFIAFVAMGLAKNKNLTGRIREISTYFATVSDFSGILEAELQVPIPLRKNAEEFLVSLISEYRHLLGSKPHISQKEKDKAAALHARSLEKGIRIM